MSSVEQERDDLVAKLKRRQIVGSNNIAKYVGMLLRKLITGARCETAAELMKKIRSFSRPLIAQDSLCIGNIVRRVLWIIREEYKREAAEAAAGESTEPQGLMRAMSAAGSLQDLTSTAQEDIDYSRRFDVKQPIMEAIQEFLDEIRDVYENIAHQAQDHVHANEVILTLGRSKTVEKFLLKVAKTRPIEVIVCEAAPDFTGHEFAVNLASKGCKTTVVSDAAIFAMMARVNKVIIGGHAVMANGGVIAHAGSHAVALAAKQHSVPVVVCTGIYKLSPQYPTDLDALINVESPASILPFDAEITHKGDVRLYNPAFDYIAPEFVSLFITNLGGFSPSYVYRLIADYYALEDYSLAED